jgi:hypothetical protein
LKSEVARQKYRTLSEKQTKKEAKRTRVFVTQVVEYSPTKHKALSSIPIPLGRRGKKTKNWRERPREIKQSTMQGSHAAIAGRAFT